MGLSSKKTKSTSTQNQNTSMTTAPTNPGWVTGGLENLGGRITETFNNFDPARLAPGLDRLQQRAADGAGALGSFLGYGGGPGGVTPGGAKTGNAGTSPLEPMGSPSGASPYGDAMNIFADVAGQGANTYNPATGQSSQYGGTTVGPAAQYGGTQVGPAAQYGGTRLGEAAQIGDVGTVRGESVLDNLESYMSPFTNDVVNTTLAGFDHNAGMTRAQQQLDIANDDTFGGSGGSILRALTEGNLSRERASTEANLRDTGFQRGAALSGDDANRRQEAGSMNLQAALERARLNQDATNTNRLTQGAMDQQTGLSNTAMQQAMRELQSRFAQETGLSNTGAENDRRLTQAGFDQQTGLTNAGRAQEMTTTNLNAVNDAGRFNAGQRDAALGRSMDAATGLTNSATAQGNDNRANVTTQAAMGEMLRKIAQEQGMAPLQKLLMESGIWNSLPLDLFKGQSSTGTMSGTGTSTGKESGAGLSDWLSYFAANASAAKGGK